MRILVDRFIYQEFRHIPRRHAVSDQDRCPEIPSADENLHSIRSSTGRNCRRVDDWSTIRLFVTTADVLQRLRHHGRFAAFVE